MPTVLAAQSRLRARKYKHFAEIADLVLALSFFKSIDKILFE